MAPYIISLHLLNHLVITFGPRESDPSTIITMGIFGKKKKMILNYTTVLPAQSTILYTTQLEAIVSTLKSLRNRKSGRRKLSIFPVKIIPSK